MHYLKEKFKFVLQHLNEEDFSLNGDKKNGRLFLGMNPISLDNP